MPLEELQTRLRALPLDDQISMYAVALLQHSDLVGAILSMTSLLGVLSTRCEDELARVVVCRHLRHAAGWIEGKRDDDVTMLH